MTQPSEKTPPFLTVLIPAHNEEKHILSTCRALFAAFEKNQIDDYEILVINDNSQDGTETSLKTLMEESHHLRYINNEPPNGFGFAVRRGLKEFKGEAVVIFMADASDAPEDVIVYYHKLKEGWECVFGSRFAKGGKVYDYPRVKLILNRIANNLLRLLFRIPHNDITNAFKGYRRNVIEGIAPILSCHFNLTIELPLKAYVRGYTWTAVPISWTNRTEGISKFHIKEMGGRYLFILLYVFFEKRLTKGDYFRKN